MRIKQELQKISPSRRCNWRKHKQMMEVDGYLDSDTNESYRCLVKAYQKATDRLPTVQQHANLVASNTLESIKQELGELNSAKLGAQQETRKLRTLMRSLNREVLFIDELKEAISKCDWIKSTEPIVQTHKCNQDLIIVLSDIHYGAIVDIENNQYNSEICARILDEYANKIISKIKQCSVKDIYVINLGDIIEHVYMRVSNTYNVEANLSEQIVNISKLLIEFLNKISKYSKNKLKYIGISGNHDRIQGNKDNNLNMDNAVYIANHIIDVWATASHANVLVEYPSDDNVYILKVKNRAFGFVHGHKHNLTNKNTLAQISNNYKQRLDCVVGGHFHHLTMLEVGENQFQIGVGSIKGNDEYSLSLGVGGCRTQGIILVDDKDFNFEPIKL